MARSRYEIRTVPAECLGGSSGLRPFRGGYCPDQAISLNAPYIYLINGSYDSPGSVGLAVIPETLPCCLAPRSEITQFRNVEVLFIILIPASYPGEPAQEYLARVRPGLACNKFSGSS